MKFGYARVSTTDQNLEIQTNVLEKYGVHKTFADKSTGKNISNRENRIMV
ncbi:recombinase family protein [Psychrilyobacter sp.]